ncbi:hypothetical protein [uncultured Cellulomonas sp.]|uniref:hypothetical protein n=1 Tax=uncultured Cellulomonas sp. TaxID=189682 RepID=UPI0026117674|nr:hypothetical protein [uncultured Cellulomonas sp.]
MTTTTPDDTVLQVAGARVVLCHDDVGHARMTVHAEPGAAGARLGGHLARDAVLGAAAHDVRCVDTVLDASTPACGVILECLRDLVGREVDALSMRRAGSSVVVTLRLTGAPPPRHRRGPAGGRSPRPAPRHGTFGSDRRAAGVPSVASRATTPMATRPRAVT